MIKFLAMNFVLITSVANFNVFEPSNWNFIINLSLILTFCWLKVYSLITVPLIEPSILKWFKSKRKLRKKHWMKITQSNNYLLLMKDLPVIKPNEVYNFGDSKPIERCSEGNCVGAHVVEVNDVADVQKFQIDVCGNHVSWVASWS